MVVMVAMSSDRSVSSSGTENRVSLRRFPGLPADRYGEGMENEMATVGLECPWVSADECAMVRERSVAGVGDMIPGCPVHGDHPETPGGVWA